jgi:nitrogen fixation NifU-like protein
MSYTPKMLEHFNNPRNAGELPNPTAIGSEGKPGQGNYMIIYLCVEGGRVAEATFKTYGCPGAISCGSAVTELVGGKTMDEAAGITPADIDAFLDGLPRGKAHCAALAAAALQDAVETARKGSG